MRRCGEEPRPCRTSAASAATRESFAIGVPAERDRVSGARAQPRRLSAAAATVAAMSSWLCAALTKPAS